MKKGGRVQAATKEELAHYTYLNEHASIGHCAISVYLYLSSMRERRNSTDLESEYRWKEMLGYAEHEVGNELPN